MKRLGSIVLGALVVSGPLAGGAEEAPLTFRSALELAIANNLDLAAARRGRAVRQAEVKTAGQHSNPDLVFESTRDTPHQTLSLDVPFEPWKRSRRLDLAREELTLADVEDAAALQELRRRVRIAFYGLLGAEEAASLATSMVAVALRVREVAQARFVEGAAPRLDVMQADLGLARAKADLELARSARASAQAELDGLLNRPPDQPLAVAGEVAEGAPLPTAEEALARARAGNAELRTAEREVAIEDRRLGLLKAERIPTPTVSLGAVFNAPGEYDVGYRAGLSLAVPLFDRNQGQIAGSLARGDQARLRRDALRRAVEARAFAAHARALAQRAQVAAYRETLLPTATAIESLAEEGYRLGRNPVLAVLDAQRTLRDAKSEYLAALVSHQSALADLEDVLGGPIE
ncbi:MAG TPA: TolC family protein [Vicinamibacteria bacterium]|nr:TolC family protein [Vicinamibacteria bacterium]